MANNIKSLQVDLLNAKQFVSRNQDNTIVDSGYVLAADGRGGTSWVANNAFATNAFGAVVVNNPITQTIYANTANRLGTTLRLVASDPITLTGNAAINQIAVGVNTAAFLTETSKRFPTEDYSQTTILNGSTIQIDCLYKTYLVTMGRRPYGIKFAVANIPQGKMCRINLIIKIDQTVTNSTYPIIIWAPNFKFSSPYTMSTTNGSVDILELVTLDRGVTWYVSVKDQYAAT
jgi:hypothetical protein